MDKGLSLSETEKSSLASTSSIIFLSPEENRLATVRAHAIHLIRTHIPRTWFTRSRLLAKIKPNRDFGLDGLDTRLAEIVQKERGFYIELGANDGVTQSNTLKLELFKGWKGVLIEPVPRVFARLKKNRSRQRNHLEMAACVSFDFDKDYVEIAFSNLMSTPLNIDSDIDDPLAHAGSGTIFLEGLDKQEALTVLRLPSSTLTAVLDRARAPRSIDLLSLDVEGGELDVLKGIDFDRYRINWMLIESRNIERIEQFLSPLGYRLHTKMSGHDYLFIWEA